MNVLIIPEDFRKDQYVVLPIVRRLLAEVGRPNANVRVCLDPLMGGIGEAMKWPRIEEVLERYRMVQLFLLMVDRDGVEGRRAALDGIEEKAASFLGDRGIRLAENAWQGNRSLGVGGAGLARRLEMEGSAFRGASEGNLFRALGAPARAIE